MQTEIAAHSAGPAIVDGAPGTGKSAALDQRMTSLVASGLDPSRIALITSTPLAAETHRRGLEARLTGPYEELVVETWEEFAERLLRHWPVEAGLDPEFEVVGPAERLAMLLVRFEQLPLRHHEIRGNPAGLMRRLLSHIDAEKAMRGAGGFRRRSGAAGESSSSWSSSTTGCWPGSDASTPTTSAGWPRR